ncbi:putative acetylxylan esterase A [Colletotrichum tanaceti]|uniref:Putative acetylxylan esterase A n=1 Tax=Colletotrichum tanaceti TaxID=1306861 RepID=A0A4U6XPV5_9PEZI|nr:putative acetylxylan esterase A [Colletotrichum tanaceti]TKW57804.1 putative acetylxylan esterase A [Colletotrichum tanaceti]
MHTVTEDIRRQLLPATNGVAFATYTLNFLLAAIPLLPQAQAAFQRIVNFGLNPTGLTMEIYVHLNLAPSPAIILTLHGCGGAGQAYARQADYVSRSDFKRTFLVIYPSSTRDSNFWDVATVATITPDDGGGDSTGLASMVW